MIVDSDEKRFLAFCCPITYSLRRAWMVEGRCIQWMILLKNDECGRGAELRGDEVEKKILL